MAEVKPEIETFARIKVVGIGGGGNSAVNRMIKAQMRGVGFLSVNSDAQDLHHSLAPEKLHIGKTTTKGLGAGSDPDLGKKAAEESRNDLAKALEGSDMVFLTCGEGGGTGTGASPVIAQIAKEIGALTVAFVTKPFGFEGTQRAAVAERGIAELKDKVDALIVIPNDKVLSVIDKKTPILEAFAVIDEVLRQGVEGIASLITNHGIVNRDFADVRKILKDAGSAMMSIGSANGENRAQEAAKLAVSSPLLDMRIDGAKGVLLNVTGGSEMSMNEVQEAASYITELADANAKVIWGAAIDTNLSGELKITVIAAGFDKDFATSELSDERQLVDSRMLFNDVPQTTPVDTFDKLEKEPAFSRKADEPVKDDYEELDIPAFIRKKVE